MMNDRLDSLMRLFNSEKSVVERWRWLAFVEQLVPACEEDMVLKRNAVAGMRRMLERR